MSDREELLVEYALGSLDASERLALERELDASPSLCARLKEVTSVLDQIDSVEKPVMPGAALKSRLMMSVRPDTRMEGLVDRLAMMFDLAANKVRELLGEAETDPRRWRPAPVAGVSLLHFEGGPRVATADCGLVRLDAGARFPQHTHHGDELVLVLEGEVHDDSGCVFRAGDFAHMAEGSVHSFEAGDEPLLIAVRMQGSIEAI